MTKRVAEPSDVGRMCRVFTAVKVYEGLLIDAGNTIGVRTGPDAEVRFNWHSDVLRIEYDPAIRPVAGRCGSEQR